MIEIRICRFCKEYGSDLLKYGVRHYAHPACGMAREGAAFFDHFSTWQLETQFPYFAAKAAGLLPELIKRLPGPADQHERNFKQSTATWEQWNTNDDTRAKLAAADKRDFAYMSRLTVQRMAGVGTPAQRLRHNNAV